MAKHLASPSGSNRAGGASKAGSSTSIAFETSPRPRGKGADCVFFSRRVQSSSRVPSGALGGGEPPRPKPGFVLQSRVGGVGSSPRFERGRRRRCHVRVARSIACAEIIVVVGLTGSSHMLSTRIGEASESPSRVCGEEHCMSASKSEGTRDSAFERWAHSADGRSGSLASGNEIAISLHVRRTGADEVTAG